MANLIWSSHTARIKTLKSIIHLFTRVTAQDIEECRNLKRIQQFINFTITDEIFIGIDLLHEMVTWIESANAIHANIKGHTGCCIYFGTVVVKVR